MWYVPNSSSERLHRDGSYCVLIAVHVSTEGGWLADKELLKDIMEFLYSESNCQWVLLKNTFVDSKDAAWKELIKDYNQGHIYDDQILSSWEILPETNQADLAEPLLDLRIM